MADVRDRVRERMRTEMLQHGAAPDLQDAALFAAVERLLQQGTDRADERGLLLPHLLGDPHTWRLATAMRYPSHRDPATASWFTLVKKRVMMPALRWLFEYSRDNFERQRRVNDVLFACVQELALETAKLRAEVGLLRDRDDRGAVEGNNGSVRGGNHGRGRASGRPDAAE